MPSDDSELTLELSPPAREVEVMTRVLRLPTNSVRQARAIVRMQLDRLSPLPVQSVVFDLVRLQRTGGETTFALGVLRRSALLDPAFSNRRVVTLARSVDGSDVVFRFRNASAVDDRERRWLSHAPKAAALALGLAAVLLAGQIRADRWRELSLPAIAAEQRIAARVARDARDQSAALQDWRSLDRSDAATRLLCVASRIAADDRAPVVLASANSEATQVTLTPVDAAGGARLAAADGKPESIEGAANGPTPVVFGPEVCT